MTSADEPWPKRCPGAHCVSDYEMDRLASGLVGGEDEAALRTRMGACEGCGARWTAILAEKKAFAARTVPNFEAVAKANPGAKVLTPARGWGRRMAVYAGPVLAAAAAFFLMTRQGVPPVEAPPGGDVRTKGAERIGYLVVRADGTVRGDDRDGVASPGEQLQWRIGLTKPRYVAILSRDGEGHVSPYYAVARLSPGEEVRAATALDGVLGNEKLFGVFCDSAPDMGSLLREIETTGALGPPAGCSVKTLALRKVASP